MDCKQECAKKYICKSHPNDCGVCMAVSFFGNRYPLFKEKDIVEVVRCKDCKHFQPCFVLTNDGERRPYTEEEIKKGKMVTGDVGINCASRCERFGYWDENKIPVWYNENDFCSYGERKDS